MSEKSLKIIIFFLLSLLTLPSCRKEEEIPIPGEPKNLILIAMDTVRADHTGIPGFSRDTTPNLKRLIKIHEKSFVFTATISPSSWTLPSFSSVFTGRYDCGIRDRDKGRLPPSEITMAEIFLGHGYKTCAVVSGIYVSREFGLSKGFQEYYPFVTDPDDVTSKDVTDKAIKWLKKNKNERFFLWITYFDPHFSYMRNQFSDNFISSFIEKRRSSIPSILTSYQRLILKKHGEEEYAMALYDGEIRYMDHEMGRLFECIYREGLLKNSLIIIFSDHGEEFWEHGDYDHGKTLYKESVHVPLVFLLPPAHGGENETDPQLIDTPVSLVDILPTLSQIFEIPVKNHDGISLDGFFQGQKTIFSKRPIYSEIYPSSPKGSYKRKVCVVYERYKLIKTESDSGESFELFDIKDDPLEIKDLYRDGDPPLNLIQMISRYPGKKTKKEKGPTLPEDLLKKIKSLGYIE